MSNEKSSSISRKEFIKRMLAASGGLALGGNLSACLPDSTSSISGKFLGPSIEIGHMIRDGNFSSSETTEETEIVIVGGGIAGLSAGWFLKKAGVENFTILELEPAAGGNSTFGENNITAYPWGAHYLPIPGTEQPEIIDLLTEMDVITGFSESGLPIFREEYLCASPQERLLLNGIWQEGLIPTRGIPQKDQDQIDNFLAFMHSLKQMTGIDGKSAFAIPESRSSQDPEFRKWDELNMATFLDQQQWTSEYIRWYVNYSLRDDFGATLENTSAWAGLHYFASRRGGGENAEDGDVLTWPEGNGWLVKQFQEKLSGHIQPNAAVVKVTSQDENLKGVVTYLDVPSREMRQLNCAKVILATPQFVNQRLIPERAQTGLKLDEFQYAPWVTANITLTEAPKSQGRPLSWDNVGYHSPSLGYINASHQQITGFPSKQKVFTWYHVLSGSPPKEARQLLYDYPYSYWQDFILADMESMHKGITKLITHIDICRWGHGMISPTPGFMNSDMRQLAQQPFGNIHFAHSDLSGISIFEEAFYQGLRAAKEVS